MLLGPVPVTTASPPSARPVVRGSAPEAIEGTGPKRTEGHGDRDAWRAPFGGGHTAITPADVRPHVERLASRAFGGRRGLGGARAALYIADHFYRLGLEPLFDTGYFQPIPAYGSAADERALGRNVGAWLPGSDPDLRHQYVILSAHYDHLGMPGGRLYPGADDNASGVAMLLEVARSLAALPPPPCSILLVAFDLEEAGLWGSRWFAAHPPRPLDEVRLFITADMIGRSLGALAEDYVFVLGSEHAPPLRDLVARCDTDPSLKVALLGTDLIGTRSDYGPFRARRVPYLFFSTGEHPDYHQPTDTPEKVDYEKLARVSQLMYGVTLEAARAPDRPDWIDRPEPDLVEVRAVHGILTDVLAHDGPAALEGMQRRLVTNTHATLEHILRRGTITAAERRWLARVSLLLLATVF
ncbi:MAG: M28 family metallopeptidase [Pirellulales bacterium]